MKVILLAEDDADDVYLLQRACALSGFPHSLQVARDGMEAVAYLAGDGPFADREKYPLPHLVFLDIKMPKMSGLEVLQWIRWQPQFVHLPVIMLTTSLATIDLKKAYEHGCNSYLRKSGNQSEFAVAMRTTLKYWLGYHVDNE